MFPVWIYEQLYGICDTAKRKGKTGVLVLKAPGMRDADAVVVLKWGDWVDLYGNPRSIDTGGTGSGN